MPLKARFAASLKRRKYKEILMKKKSTFLKDFKAFISKGSVLDLAVATIIGAAFGQIVSSFTNGIVMPLISLLFKAENLDKLVIELRPEVTNEAGEVITAAITWQYGTLIQAVINFLIIALFLFILVRTIRKIQKELNFNEQIRTEIQKKLDADEPLTEIENKWMKRMQKKDPDSVPVKTPAPVPAPAPEPTATEKMLAEIIELLKEKK